MKPDPFCCEVFPHIAGHFRWFRYEERDGETHYAMPSLPEHGTDWRVNHCPSCGKEVRGITLTQDQYISIAT